MSPSMRKILFQHIPKTAGTSLIAGAAGYFGKAMCPARYEHEMSGRLIEDDAFTFYHGHFSRDLVLDFRRRCPDAFIFTFVRHPFTRILSQYHNWIDALKVREELDIMEARGAERRRLEKLRTKFEEVIFGLSLDAFLASEDPDIQNVVYNLQAQYVTELQLPNHLRFNKTALNAISTYNFIGLQELYSPCLRIIEAICGLPGNVFGGQERFNARDHRNSGGKYVVTSSQLALLEAKSIYDLVLFHLCYALLLTQYGGHFPQIVFDIDRIADLPTVDDAGEV